jgi:tRNA pseudouridine65 synthase
MARPAPGKSSHAREWMVGFGPMSSIEILYRDGALVAVDKPAGLAVHRGWAQDDRYAMTEVRDLLGQWVYPVHRLDRGASGVLVFGLSPESARALCEQFERHEVEKTYWALVRGAPADDVTIDHALKPDNSEQPQPAVTRVRRLEQHGRYAWVEARPLTGRLHQIRRHLKHVSCPLIGDVKYGKGEHNRLFRERYGLQRLALHAARLSIKSPDNDAQLELQAPLPSDLARALELLRSNEAISSS